MSSTADRKRVLLGVLVYNGGTFVLDCLRSMARLCADDRYEVDVLVLDDCSPEPGWSESVAALAQSEGLQYYRTPRNLGIPRNMNLALLRGAEAGYDHVVLCNSDIIVPANLVDALVTVAEAHPRAASVTAWSNNVSMFSLPNLDPDQNVAHQGAVDFLSATLHAEFGTEGLAVPTAVGFCMLIPTAAIQQVGLLDPVFGRGYCEEVDWSLRADRLGLENVLAPSAFVYHVGSATTSVEGILDRGHSTSAANEAILDMRYPAFRRQVATFADGPTLDQLINRGLRAIVVGAAREWGYAVVASWLHRKRSNRQVQFVVEPDGRRPLLTGRFQGFEVGFDLHGSDVLGAVERIVGTRPAEVSVFDHGAFADALVDRADENQLSVTRAPSYPERI